MSTERHEIRVADLTVEVVRKDIKNLHVGVYPPDGHVRVAAPLRLDDEAVRLAVVSRLGWIKRQRASFAAQERQSARELVNGESHYLWGQRYLLDVVEEDAPPRVTIHSATRLVLRVRPGSDIAARQRVLLAWYRAQLKEAVPSLIAQWEPALGVTVAGWGVRRMKTRWGSCNPDAGRIWLNLELAKKPPRCLEYIVVHEMVHLRERHHNARFVALMDEALPQWRLLRDALNQAPLAHAEWKY